MKTSSSVELNDLPNRTLITPDEAARFFAVSRKTIYNWIDQGFLDAVRRKGTIRLERHALIKFFAASTEK